MRIYQDVAVQRMSGGGAALRAAASGGESAAVARLIGGAGGTRSLKFSRDELGRSALHLACSAGHAAIVRQLLGAAAPREVDSADGAGCTPLQRAAADGHEEVVRLLLAKGADVDRQDNVHGNSAIHEAAWKGYSRTIRILAETRADLRKCNAGGFTALHLCCQNGHNQACRELLLAGCDPDLPNNYGDTALHTAARYGHAGVTRILISAQCRVSEQNKNGDTALHIAAAMGRRKLTRILLEAGCDATMRNKQNETARDIAVRKELDEILAILDEGTLSPLSKRAKYKKRTKAKVQVTGATSPSRSTKTGAAPRTATQAEPLGKSQWSPYGCHYYPDPDAFPSPRLDTLPPEPLKRGEQYYLDLAGNIRKGPVGVGYTCYCAPLFRHLEAKLEKDKRELQKAQAKLGQRVTGLEQKLNRGVRGRRSERAYAAAKETDVGTLTRSKSLQILEDTNHMQDAIPSARSMDELDGAPVSEQRKSVKELVAQIQQTSPTQDANASGANDAKSESSDDEEALRLVQVRGPMGDTNMVSPSYENVPLDSPRSRSGVYSPELRHIEPVVKVQQFRSQDGARYADAARFARLRLIDAGKQCAQTEPLDTSKIFESTARMLEHPAADRDTNNDSGYSTKMYGSSKGNSPSCQIDALGASSLV
ncbi:ankyrin repeat domain-containing protein 6 isoform X2 [Atheta coriaria]|uniref:ankyrin repeat domain-containing protein 6 isoform X2 n=1 Tax=Dalotia coriaria TaxID=877792 RepID=UPI0031F414DE